MSEPTLADEIVTAYMDRSAMSINTFNRLMKTALTSMNDTELLALHDRLWPLPCVGEKYIGMNQLSSVIHAVQEEPVLRSCPYCQQMHYRDQICALHPRYSHSARDELARQLRNEREPDEQ